RDLGPSLTVMTRGGDGGVGFCSHGRVAGDAVRVAVADTVGAGDTFSAGILDALASRDVLGADARPQLAELDAEAVQQVLDRAAQLAAITVSRPGGDPPWSHEAP
ncbi:MAG: PfkB family carbohydrate kinase, partial [Brachybacterium sp.]|nr:PfkB family carbohydrate kinase [Brachybacterium sp.]